VVASGQPYVSRELRHDPRMPASVREFVPEGRGGACVPLRAGEEITGALYLNTDLPREFSADDVHLLSTLAEIAGIAMQRTRLHDETEQRLGQLSALREIDRAIMGSLDLRLTLQIVLTQVMRRLGVDAATVLLFNRATGLLTYGAAQGTRTRAVEKTSLRLGQSYSGRVALERKLLQATDLNQPGSDFVAYPQLAAEKFVSYVGAPLIAKGELVGVLEVFQRTRLTPSAEWLSFLEALAGQAAIAVDNATLFARLERSNMDLQLAYDATIEGWSRALDLRDKETEGHSQRVTEMTEALAQRMGLGDEALLHLRRGALLHDIGKMGVPDGILLKPGPLNDDEWQIMRQHPRFAYEMLAPIGYLAPALDIPYCHHEKWDGSGYPRGLAGEQIPLAARLFAVVDVWDALRSNRPYRPAWPASRVREHLRAQAGKHFDPAVVEAFLGLRQEE
jgi:putative nucleotidyltransferase with HDIG domain